MSLSQEYRYLLNSSGGSDSNSLDANGVTIYTHNADGSFTTETVGASKETRYLQFIIIPSSIVGTGGSLVLQFSDDGINYKTLLDDSGNSITWTVDNTLTEDYALLKQPAYPHYRLNYTVGSVTGGTLQIRLMRN